MSKEKKPNEYKLEDLLNLHDADPPWIDNGDGTFTAEDGKVRPIKPYAEQTKYVRDLAHDDSYQDVLEEVDAELAMTPKERSRREYVMRALAPEIENTIRELARDMAREVFAAQPKGKRK